MIRLVCFAAAVFAIYWFGFRDSCGSRGALACPPPELEQGVGTILDAAEVCKDAGYLCAQGRNFQIVRWGLDKGRLRVRVPPVEFLSGANERRVREAVVEGIKHGMTAKETAYAYEYGLRAVQEAANRMGVSFVYSGTGRPPKHLPNNTQ
jgi:hypothetical protein